MKNRLTMGDFKRNGMQGSFAHHFSHKNNEHEICLEACLGGYCVAKYDLDKNLIGKKICTNMGDQMAVQIMPGFSPGTGEALRKALKIANTL